MQLSLSLAVCLIVVVPCYSVAGIGLSALVSVTVKTLQVNVLILIRMFLPTVTHSMSHSTTKDRKYKVFGSIMLLVNSNVLVLQCH